MAYSTPFDPTTPTDASWAHEGDDEIRKIKAALIERFSRIFTNFPDGDPLVFKPGVVAAGVSVGPRAERPEFPAGVGVVYLTTDTDQLFFGMAAEGASGYQWKEFRGSGAPSGQVNLTLTPQSQVVTSGQSVTFTALAKDGGGNALVGTWKWFANGVQIAGQTASTLVYTVSSTVTIKVEFTSANGAKGTAESVQTVGTTSGVNPPYNLRASDGSTCASSTPKYGVNLTFDIGTVGASTKVYRGGVHVITLAAGTTSYKDESLTAAGTYSYEIEHEKGGVVSTRIPASVAIVDPCVTTTKAPTGLTATNDSFCSGADETSIPVYGVMLKWTNTETSLQIKVYRGTELRATLSPGTTQFGDSWMDTEIITANYYVAYLKGDSTDGPPSNNAYIKIDKNPCGGPRGF